MSQKIMLIIDKLMEDETQTLIFLSASVWPLLGNKLIYFVSYNIKEQNFVKTGSACMNIK